MREKSKHGMAKRGATQSEKKRWQTAMRWRWQIKIT